MFLELKWNKNVKLHHLCYRIIKKNMETSILRVKLESGCTACKHMNIKASPYDELEKVLISCFKECVQQTSQLTDRLCGKALPE